MEVFNNEINGNIDAVINEVDAQNENYILTEVEIEGVAGGTTLAGIQSY